MQEKNKITGTPVSRIDGILKVTGKADYSTDHPVKNAAYAILFKSTIAAGKIKDIDTSAAEKSPGVLAVITHKNAPKLNVKGGLRGGAMLQGPDIEFHGQHIGLVVAETFELARYAASIITVDYEEETFSTDIHVNLDKARAPKAGLASALKPPPPKPKGDFEKAFDNSAAQASGEFFHGTEHHNPLELFTTTTIYEGDGKLTIYDKTQGTVNCQLYVGNVFGLHFIQN